MSTSAIERAVIGAIIFTLLFLAASNIPALAAYVQAFMLKGIAR